jgi:hypothetical protein
MEWPWVRNRGRFGNLLGRMQSFAKGVAALYAVKKRRLLLWLPYTKEHLRIRDKVFRVRCRRTLHEFQQIVPSNALDDFQRVYLRHHVVQVEAVRTRVVLRQRIASLFLPLLSLPAVVPYVVIHSQLNPRNWFEELIFFSAYGSTFLVAWAIPGWLFRWELPISWVDVVVGTLAVGSALSIRDLPGIFPIVISGAAGSLATLLCVFMWAFISVGIYKVARSKDQTKHPEAHITVSLLRLLLELESFPHIGLRETRLRLVDSLGHIANLFAVSCSRAYRTGTSGMDLQLSLQFQEIANGFGEMKSWVLFPGVDTRERLRTRLRLYLPSVITGAWSELPRSEYRESQISKTRIWVGYMKYFAIAVMPLTTLFLVQLVPWAPLWSESFRRFEYGAFALVWACLWILKLFYRYAEPQLEYLRKVLEMLTLLKK